MLRSALRRRRSLAVLGAGLVAGAVLTGCAAKQTPTTPAAATGPAESSTTPAPSSDLADGLLPADAFGEGADVDVLPFDGVPFFGHWGHWGHGHWGDWGDVDESVTPTACETALDEAATRFDDVQDAAGQVAHSDGIRTFEVLAVPAEPDVVKQFQAVVDACGDVSFSEEHGHGDLIDVQVSVDPLPGLPEGMAGVSVTFSGTYPDGSWAANALLGVAQDRDRVLLLAQMSRDDAALDPAAFQDLLQQAYDVQSDALD
jgi:hypothetical protein